MAGQVFRSQYEQYAQLKYSDRTTRKVEIRDTESMEAFKEGVPEIVRTYTVGVGVGYWSNGLLGIYVQVPELGIEQMLEEVFTAETPVHIDSFVDNLVKDAVDVSQKFTGNGPAVGPELAGELKEKLGYAAKSGINELTIG